MTSGKKKRGPPSEPVEAEGSHRSVESSQAEAPAAAAVPAGPTEEPAATSRAPDRVKAASPEPARPAIAAEVEIALGQIVWLLIRSAHHKQHSLADLEWLLLPAVLAGQFRIAHVQAQPNGPRTSVAAALWASVSSEVDQRLSDLSNPLRLRPEEWRSGDILWLVDTVGDARVVPQLLKHLQETAFIGRDVKARVRREDGKTGIGVLRGASRNVSGSG